MRLRWTPRAADDLEEIADHIKEDRPETALLIVRRILHELDDLKRFPNRGRLGRKPGTREIVLAGLPYLAVYRVRRESIEIVRVLHGAQRWPPLNDT